MPVTVSIDACACTETCLAPCHCMRVHAPCRAMPLAARAPACDRGAMPATVSHAVVEAALDRFPPVRGPLDAAPSGVPPIASVAAARDALAMWAGGQITGPSFDSMVDRARAAYASLLGVGAEDVACGG